MQYGKSLAYFPLVRFCSDCCQESTETSWSDRFQKRLCMDCYNLICEGIEFDYRNEDFEL